MMRERDVARRGEKIETGCLERVRGRTRAKGGERREGYSLQGVGETVRARRNGEVGNIAYGEEGGGGE